MYSITKFVEAANHRATREISNDALKIHYRKLVADNQPDKMIARGVPPEFVSKATKKIASTRPMRL
jgi:DnaJ-domain-containing protein 1